MAVTVRTGRGWSLKRLCFKAAPEARFDALPRLQKPAKLHQRRSRRPWAASNTSRPAHERYQPSPQQLEPPVRNNYALERGDLRIEGGLDHPGTTKESKRRMSLNRHIPPLPGSAPAAALATHITPFLRLDALLAAPPLARLKAPAAARLEDAMATIRSRSRNLVVLAEPMPVTARRPSPPSGARRRPREQRRSAS